ncbi:protein phosphatase 1 regulatory subunit 14C-like protein [Dinothrombium tinctorium]|uniref:Protein phosphatase 1 regulatory subunit 14C-like protein n=1 Tax=Dinothrombium tinctorium TaxID=1965070 RepID=A0A443RJ79_9ACAR|nr:protein phosphatase 1 regulatory subunit 14C-like protein [Dinothrombium tinctorium]
MLHVNFKTDKEEISERKKKYLTAKYGQHQMSLIKKRLRVEMWMYEQLQNLYDNNEIEIDLDELLDMEDSNQRKEWLKLKLIEAKRPQNEVELFIGELLEKANIL